ncbi:MAG: replication factor C large subunit [Candidatus Marsarchaeota archaeon]|jgi:replication factor C large subunit|nr:replication factor C large subunit [Candidatus Marsarchaeota archaeon]
MLCEKYEPTTLGQLIGNSEARKKIAVFISDIVNGKQRKPLLLFGPSGTGKTAAIHAAAASNGFGVLELSGSDYRNVEKLKKTLVPATRSKGLFNKTVLVLLDEIDELSGKFDSGAERVISEVIKTSLQPIIFTANDFWDRKIEFLRNSVEKVEFKKVSDYDIALFLKEIAKREGCLVKDEVVDTISKRSNGDVRGAMNDLEAMLGSGIELLDNLGVRDAKIEVFGVLDKIFKTSSFDIAKNAAVRSEIDLEMLINWVDENIPNRYRSKRDIERAYSALAEASKLSNNATRTNYYGYLRYAQILASSGVSLAGSGNVTMLTPYAFPTRIRFLSATKKTRSGNNAIAEKLSTVLHSSSKQIINSYLPLIRSMLRNLETVYGEEKMMEMAYSSFRLDEDDVKFIISVAGPVR